MEVHIPIIGFHYDEEIFPDPPTFDPERLTAEAVAERHPMAFMPYGQGLRNCFRFKFALLLAKVPTSCTVQSAAVTQRLLFRGICFGQAQLPK